MKPVPPSYEEMGIARPEPKRQRDSLTKNAPLPVKYIVCFKCKKMGGTLVRNGEGYIHPDCLAGN